MQNKSNLLNNKGLDASYKLLKHSIRYAIFTESHRFSWKRHTI